MGHLVGAGTCNLHNLVGLLHACMAIYYAYIVWAITLVVGFNPGGGIDYATSGGQIDDIKSQIDDFKQQIVGRFLGPLSFGDLFVRRVTFRD